MIKLLQIVSEPAFVILLGFAGLMGLLAVASPGRFRAISRGTSRWVDSYKFLAILDKPFDVDRHVLRHTRAFGAMVVLAVSVLAFVYIVY